MPSSATTRFSGIFVSYRRDDSSGHAGRLYDNLVNHFGADRIFMDIDTIEPGEDFVTVIENAVGSCDILIAIIGRHWLSGTGESSRRLDNPNDFVRLEIATALSRDIRVVPVLVQRASMPDPQDLPDDLAKLSRRNSVELSDLRWQRDVDQLIEALERVLAKREEALRLAEATRLAEAERGRQEEEKRRLEEEKQLRLAEDGEKQRAAKERRGEEEEVALRQAEERAKHEAQEASRRRAEEERAQAEAEQRSRAEPALHARREEEQPKPDLLPSTTSTPSSGPAAQLSDTSVVADIAEARQPREVKSKRTMFLVIAAGIGIVAIVTVIAMSLKPGGNQRSANQNEARASALPTVQTTAVQSNLTAAENNSRGDDLFKQKEYAEAETYFREAIRLLPGNPMYLDNLGLSLARQRTYSEAESHYREAVRLEPGNAVFHNDLGISLARQNKYAEADRSYREALRLDPGDPVYHNNLGVSLERQTKYPEAEIQYREAVRSKPGTALYHNNLGDALYYQRKYSEAESHYREAVRLEPNSAVYQEDLKKIPPN